MTGTQGSEATRELEEQRDFLLDSLRDLEAEHDAGDIDDVDYQTLRDDYTARAASALRALADPPIGSAHDDAGDAATARALPASAHDDADEPAAARGLPASAGPSRPGWLFRHRRSASIGAAVVIVLGGISWAVVASSSQREAGEEITGQGVGASQETKLLLAAQQAADRGDSVTELRDARSVLASDPTQPQALTMEGWLLAQTQQPKLLAQGITLLSLAEEVDPSFAQAHAYRAIAFLSKGDNRDAIPELRWYLNHRPNPKLAPKFRASLAKAEAAVAHGEGTAKAATDHRPVPAGE